MVSTSCQKKETKLFKINCCKMSRELKLLRPILKKKRHSIQFGVQIWLYFKAHILEKKDRRKALENDTLSRAKFSQWIETRVNPRLYGPNSMRKDTGDAANKIRDLINICYMYY